MGGRCRCKSQSGCVGLKELEAIKEKRRSLPLKLLLILIFWYDKPILEHAHTHNQIITHKRKYYISQNPMRS